MTPLTTVQNMLDDLAAGRRTLDDVATAFRGRRWGPARPQASDAQAYGVVDDEPAGDNEWGTVERDSRLSPEQYAVLATAMSEAASR